MEPAFLEGVFFDFATGFRYPSHNPNLEEMKERFEKHRKGELHLTHLEIQLPPTSERVGEPPEYKQGWSTESDDE